MKIEFKLVTATGLTSEKKEELARQVLAAIRNHVSEHDFGALEDVNPKEIRVEMTC